MCLAIAGDMWVLVKHLYSLHHTDTASQYFYFKLHKYNL